MSVIMKKHISKKARDRNFYFEIASIRIFSSYNPDAVTMKQPLWQRGEHNWQKILNSSWYVNDSWLALNYLSWESHLVIDHKVWNENSNLLLAWYLICKLEMAVACLFQKTVTFKARPTL